MNECRAHCTSPTRKQNPRRCTASRVRCRRRASLLASRRSLIGAARSTVSRAASVQDSLGAKRSAERKHGRGWRGEASQISRKVSAASALVAGLAHSRGERGTTICKDISQMPCTAPWRSYEEVASRGQQAMPYLTTQGKRKADVKRRKFEGRAVLPTPNNALRTGEGGSRRPGCRLLWRLH